MSGRQQTYVLGLHALVAVLVIAAATVLAALHDIDAQAIMVVFGATIGLAGGSAGAIATLGAATNGKATIPQPTLDTMQATLADTVDHLAGARATIDSTSIAGGRRATDPPPLEAEPSPAAAATSRL